MPRGCRCAGWSTLRTFGPLFDVRAVEPDRPPTRSRVAAELGTVQPGAGADQDVLRVGGTRRRARGRCSGCSARSSNNGARLREVLGEDRSRLLLDHLRLIDDGDHTADADASSPIARYARILAKRLCRAGVEDEPERMHSARKAAKRVRYAAGVVAGDAVSLAEPLPLLPVPGSPRRSRSTTRPNDCRTRTGHCRDLVTWPRLSAPRRHEHPVVPSRPALLLAGRWPTSGSRR
ncbi:MAG: CHAD domain-containing protein [Nocardioidaceae bacterium]